MNWNWGSDESKFKRYIKKIYDNDTWLKHKKQLESQKPRRPSIYDESGALGSGEDEVEKGHLYLVGRSDGNYSYYYLPTSLDEEKYGKGVGFMIYLPTEHFKKRYSALPDWAIYHERLTSLLTYAELLMKISLPHQLINWNNLPWGDVK